MATKKGVKEQAAIPVRTGRAGRPPQALITREAAAEAALAHIDRDGLSAFSLQGVAQILGVSAPSLYYHFKDKDELLAEVARGLLEEIGREPGAWTGDWETRTIEISIAARRVMLRHPNAAPLTLRYFPRKIMLPAYERSLRDCPYPPEAQAAILEALEKFNFGSALFAAAAEAQNTPAMPPVDAEHFPCLHRAVEAAPDADAVHAEALRSILDGFRARFGTEARPRRAS